MALPKESRVSAKASAISVPAGPAAGPVNLTGRLINVAEEERKHLARELHDDIGQRLSLLAVSLDVLKNDPKPEDSIRDKLDDALREVKDLADDIHNLSHRLHSTKLQHLGLPAALRELCRQIGEQHRVQIDLQTTGCPPLSDDVSLCFYRVAQEALTNAVKHSRSKRIEVRLGSARNRVRLLVKDFGVGVDPAMQGDGLGLATMQERLGMVGGTLSIRSRVAKGTDLIAEAAPQGGRLLLSPQQFTAKPGASNGRGPTTQDGVRRNSKQLGSALKHFHINTVVCKAR
jgi:signal transduction histidine kinase